MKKKFLVFFLAVVSFVTTRVCFADTPSSEIKSAIDQVRTICTAELGKAPDAQVDEKLSKLIYPLFDFEEMSKRSLGPNWNKATADEQKQFVDLFSNMLARTYLKRIKRNATSSKIDQMTETIDGDKAFVKSTVLVDEDNISIDYRLFLKDSKWKIYDVVIENVGLVSNYRNEFGGIVRKDGMSGLIKQLQTKKDDQVITK